SEPQRAVPWGRQVRACNETEELRQSLAAERRNEVDGSVRPDPRRLVRNAHSDCRKRPVRTNRPSFIVRIDETFEETDTLALYRGLVRVDYGLPQPTWSNGWRVQRQKILSAEYQSNPAVVIDKSR